MFRKYRSREKWFADHRLFKTAPIWYQPALYVGSDRSRDTLKEVEAWRHSFDAVMSSDNGRVAFNEFLYQNLADEYLMFWHAVQVSKRETDQEKLRPLVKDLYDAFVKNGAIFYIELEKPEVELIRLKMQLEYLDLEDIFDNAQKQAEIVLKGRFYPDFVQSRNLQFFAAKIHNGAPHKV